MDGWRVSAFRIPRGLAAGGRFLISAVALLFFPLSLCARGDGTQMFYVGEGGTDGPAQSKCWFAVGSWWCVMLDGIDANFLYRLTPDGWIQQTPDPGPFNTLDHARADVWNAGESIYVLMHHSREPRLHKFELYGETYGPAFGWPSPVLFDFNSETATIAVDSRGRVWVAYDVRTFPKDMCVVSSTGDDRSYATSYVIASGASLDDICTLTAFNGDRIGVAWSDQTQRHFGFRVHLDGDPPDVWQPVEIVASEARLPDNHISLAAASDGRVFMAVKTNYNTAGRTMVGLYVRSADGRWSDLHEVSALTDSTEATKPVLLLSERENRLYVAYTNRAKTPAVIERRSADMDSLEFGPRECLISLWQGHGGLGLDHCSSAKRGLTPESGFLVIATDVDRRVAYYAERDILDPAILSGPPGELWVIPNPAREGADVRIVLRAAGSDPASAGQLTIVDILGRRIRTLVPESQAVEGWSYSWDGRDETGRKADCGVYCAMPSSGAAEPVRIIRLR